MKDWLPGYRTERRNNGGLVTWLPNRATQQWRTGYLATEQSDATMEDWLPGYRTERRNNGGLVTWLPNRATQQWRTGHLATEQCKPNNRKRFYLVGLEPTLKGDTTERAMVLLRASSWIVRTRRLGTTTTVTYSPTFYQVSIFLKKGKIRL
jgi:hypothetical protein